MSTSATEHAQAPASDTARKETWLLLASFYGVIVGGTVPMAVAELSPVYTLLAAFLCTAHALIVGAGGRPLLSNGFCKLLSVGALLFALVETTVLGVHISYSLGHFMVLVQIVLLYGRHRPREMRMIPIVALFELMVAGIWALDLVYLPAFLVSAGAVMANLIAVDMNSDGSERRRGPALPAVERSVSWRDFLAAAWLPALVVLAVTVVVFPLLPRFEGLGPRRSLSPQMVTGFSENVSLRDVGLLRQSDRVAFRVQYLRQDEKGHPVIRPHEVLMRGTSLPLYRRGQWFGYFDAMRPGNLAVPFSQSLLNSSYFASQNIYELRNVNVPRKYILQKVKLEERPGRTLFALYRPLQLDVGTPYELVRSKTSHDLINPVGSLKDNAYEVVSMVPQFSPKMLRQAGTPRPSPPWLAFWEVPDRLQPVLDQVRREVEDKYHPESDYDRVVSTVRYLMDPTRFSYTLEMPDYGNKDPVEAFLTQTHRGSCEQFSSALALVLRTWQIPTRLVVGYKGGTYDPSDQSFVFRDRDAHAWVEVYFSKLGWVEFDPTPGSTTSLMEAAGASTALPGLFQRLQRAASGLFYYANTHWNLHVIGYGRRQQRAFVDRIGEAATGLAQDATAALRSIWPGLPAMGFLEVVMMVAAITFAGIGLYLGAGWLERAIGKRRRRRPTRTVRFYEELLAILRRKGIRRPLHQTPREFAHDAAARLAQGDDEVGGAIDLVTDLYYRARFGCYELDAEEEARIREALRKLKNTPRPQRAPAGKSPAPA